MRLLVIIPTVFGGGAEQVAALLSQEWAKTHTVSVLTWVAPGECLDFGVPVKFAHLGVQRGLWRKVWNVWARVRRVQAEVRAFAPDAVLTFMDEAGVPATLAATLGGWRQRLVVSVHHNPLWLATWRRFLLRLMYRLPARVVAVSQGVAQALVQRLALPAARVVAIPNPLLLSATALHVASDLPAQAYILSVGRLDCETKGLDVLFAAYAALPQPRPPLCLVGDGPDRRLLEALAQRLGIQDSVRFVGWVRDPRPYYRGAAVFVLTSRYEGWSNVLMEAMGEACPVLSSDCPYGPPEVLGEALHEFLLPVGDVPALSAALARMLTLTSQERAVLAQRLQARAAVFAVAQIASRWIAMASAMQAEEAAR